MMLKRTKFQLDKMKENSIVVELGVKTGHNALELLKYENGKIKKLYLVDVWGWTPKTTDKVKNDPMKKNRLRDKERDFQEVKEKVKATLEEYNSNSIVECLRMTTTEAAKHFVDKSVDFVYIDASPDLDSCWEDIITWFPKLKNDGVLAGHDFDAYRGTAITKFMTEFPEIGEERTCVTNDMSGKGDKKNSDWALILKENK